VVRSGADLGRPSKGGRVAHPEAVRPGTQLSQQTTGVGGQTRKKKTQPGSPSSGPPGLPVSTKGAPTAKPRR